MPLDPALRDRIVASVEEGFDEQIAFTQELIRFPSTARRRARHAGFRLPGASDRAAMRMDRFEMDRERSSAIPAEARSRDEHSRGADRRRHPSAARGDRPLADPAGPCRRGAAGPADMWTHPPFDPVIEGDWLYGRGGADMKAGHAANLFALDALRRIGLQPAATVYVQSVVEEESTGNGALMTHLRGYEADAVLIPEPEDEKLVRANTGVLWFEVEVRGMPVHVREMGAGANAIDAAYRVIGELRELGGGVERAQSRPRAFRERGASDQPQHRQDRGRRLGLLGAGWCRLDCRDLDLSRACRRKRLRAEITEPDRGLRAGRPLPREHRRRDRRSTASRPKAMSSSPVRKPRPCSAARTRKRPASRWRAS